MILYLTVSYKQKSFFFKLESIEVLLNEDEILLDMWFK